MTQLSISLAVIAVVIAIGLFVYGNKAKTT
jgi:hypothetical protein